jgi:succinate dehydrogenase / fumarate reductase membrane anchor subunit
MRETRLWSLHLLAIPVIIVLLGMHFAVQHYAPVFYGSLYKSIEDARSFEAMIARGKDMTQFVLYVLLLIAGLYHGLYGLRGIIRELPLTPVMAKAVDYGILLVGIGIFALGTYVTWWTFSFKVGG